MRVLLIDDHELVWNGTRRLLSAVVADDPSLGELEFEAVPEVDQALAHTAWRPDLILLDYHLQETRGLEGLLRVRSHFEDATVCILSGVTDKSDIRAALDAGAAGFIPKSYGSKDIESAIRLVLRHRVYAPAEFLFAQEVARGQEADEVASDQLKIFLRSELSGRQRQVLALALRGLPNKSIARQLDIAEGTVKVHLSMVYRALGVRNRVSALCRVLEADAAGALES